MGGVRGLDQACRVLSSSSVFRDQGIRSPTARGVAKVFPSQGRKDADK